MFGADDLTIKREGRLVDPRRRGDAARYVLRTLAPGAPLRERARHLRSLVATGVDGARALGAMRCERGAARPRPDLGPEVRRSLFRAGLLHDIGKLGVSSRILDKPGKLTDAEWVQMRRHPSLSYALLRQVPALAGVAELSARHHERLDGRGYYRGLTGDQLDTPARVLAVADVADMRGSRLWACTRARRASRTRASWRTARSERMTGRDSSDTSCCIAWRTQPGGVGPERDPRGGVVALQRAQALGPKA